MTTPTSSASQIKKLAESEKKVDEAEDRIAALENVPAGHARVRLIRPLSRVGQAQIPAGVCVLPLGDIPKSAKVLAEGPSASVKKADEK